MCKRATVYIVRCSGMFHSKRHVNSPYYRIRDKKWFLINFETYIYIFDVHNGSFELKIPATRYMYLSCCQ